MYQTFRQCADLIKQNTEKSTIYYLHNIGNWGDALIRFGSLSFLRHFKIPYTELLSYKEIQKNSNITKNDVLIYQGNGAFCRFYDHSHLISWIQPFFKTIIVLPSTFEFPIHIPNTIFFCRDSYESKINMPSAIFCHDMAFFIQMAKLPDGFGIGYFFRTDVESLGIIPLTDENYDISNHGNQFSPIFPFFEKISRYNIIYTDRLHVAIAGCLLGLEVHLYPGKYFKNRAIYLSSIKDNYSKVIFHEDFNLP